MGKEHSARLSAAVCLARRLGSAAGAAASAAVAAPGAPGAGGAGRAPTRALAGDPGASPASWVWGPCARGTSPPHGGERAARGEGCVLAQRPCPRASRRDRGSAGALRRLRTRLRSCRRLLSGCRSAPRSGANKRVLVGEELHCHAKTFLGAGRS